MHIFFFSHKLPLLLFTCILCQQSFAADQTHPDRAALKAIRDFTLASDSSSSPSNQGALLPLTPDPVNTAHNDGDDPAASIMSASKKECSSSSSTGGNTKTSENKRRRRSSSGESCEWDDNGKGSETEMGTDYDIHIPDTFVDRSKHQFFYPHTLEEDPSTCEAPLLTPVCDDGSYMIAQPDSRAPINPFHFNLPFCRPRTFEHSFPPPPFPPPMICFFFFFFFFTFFCKYPPPFPTLQ